MHRDPTINILKSDLEAILKDQYGSIKAMKPIMRLGLGKKIQHRKPIIQGTIEVTSNDPIKLLSKVIHIYRKSKGHVYSHQGITPGHKDWPNLEKLYPMINAFFNHEGIEYNQANLKKLVEVFEEVSSKFYFGTIISKFDRVAELYRAHEIIEHIDIEIMDLAVKISEYYQSIHKDYYGLAPDVTEDPLEFIELLKVADRVYENEFDYKEMIDVLFKTWDKMQPPRIGYVATRINQSKVLNNKGKKLQTVSSKAEKALERLRNGRNNNKE